MIQTIQRVPPQWRRSAVVATAVILAGLAVASLRPDRQVVQVSTPEGMQAFHVPVDSPELASLRKRMARQAIARRVRKPDEYYRAAWRLQAAAYYLQRSEQQFESDSAGLQPPQAVIQAAYQQGDADLDAAAKGVTYWRAQYANAEREFESIAARLPSPASEAGTHRPIAFGPVVAAASTPGEAFALMLLGLAAGWGYYRASRPRPAAILLQTNRKVIVKSEWLVNDRSRPHQTLKRIDQAAWGCAVIALIVWAV